jgi:hypothetical protein
MVEHIRSIKTSFVNKYIYLDKGKILLHYEGCYLVFYVSLVIHQSSRFDLYLISDHRI